MPEHIPLTVPIYVTVGRSGGAVVGYTWRIWSSRTSFYLKSRAPGVEFLKLSLHSEDPRHPGLSGFKLDTDTEERYQGALSSGRTAGHRRGTWPVWFPGMRLTGDATLAVRLRWTWDAVTRLPRAPDPGPLKAGAVGLAVPPPHEPGDAMDVDLIVSTARPHWFQETNARPRNACLGPLRNESGDWLTGTVVKRSDLQYPSPQRAIGPRPTGRSDELRALGCAVDDEGVLWMVEQRMSRSAMAEMPGAGS